MGYAVRITNLRSFCRNFQSENLKPRRRWMNNIKMTLKEAAYENEDRIQLLQDMNQRYNIMNTTMHILARK
jgi:hypothetical protein